MGDNDDGVIGWIRGVVLDSADPWRQASFWAGLLGGTPTRYPGWVTLEQLPHGQRRSFRGTIGAAQTVPVPGMHFDVLVSELDAARERVTTAGREPCRQVLFPTSRPGGEVVRWRVYQDRTQLTVAASVPPRSHGIQLGRVHEADRPSGATGSSLRSGRSPQPAQGTGR